MPRGFSESRIHDVVRTLRRWTETSVLLGRLGATGLLSALLAGVTLVSVGFVYQSNLGAGVKFLSFALLAVAVAALARHVTEPPAE